MSGVYTSHLQGIVTLAGHGPGMVLDSRETAVDKSSYLGLPTHHMGRTYCGFHFIEGKTKL